MDLQAPLSLTGASNTYSRHKTCQRSHPLVYKEHPLRSTKIPSAMHIDATKSSSRWLH